MSDIDRCYRLKLFFEQFGIRSCILNSELPLNSRVHVVEEFNRHVYDIIIAADEKNEMLGDDEEPAETAEAQDDAKKSNEGDDAETEAKRPKKKAKKSKGGDKEYGVSRGMLRPAPKAKSIPVKPLLTEHSQVLISRRYPQSSISIFPLQHQHTHIE